MSFLFINKILWLSNFKTRTAMNARISVFISCVEAIIYLLLYNLHDCTFKCDFCMAQTNQILLFSGMPVWQRSDITVWEWNLLKKKNSMKVLGLCLPYVKRYFQEDQLSVFFFMAEITKVLLFSLMPILQRSKITVWERHLLKKNLLWMFLVCVYLTWKGMFISTSKVLFSLWLK